MTRSCWMRLTAAALVVAAGSACQSAGRLAEYDFAGRGLWVVYDFPPRPEILTGPYFPGHPRDPVHAIIRAGGAIAREVAAAGARDRLDAAGERVDVAGRLADRASTRAARFLRTDVVEQEADADFGLEVRIRDYGIDAEEWDAALHFFIDAEVVLFDAVDGSEIWASHVRERDPVGPHVFGRGAARTVRDVITVAVLTDMSEDDMVRALEGLADYAADRISERLRDSLEDVREDRRIP